MLWAIMRGSFALAKTLWVRTETPLRAALLGHEICRKLLEEKARGEALGRQLRELMEHLLGRACGLLDNIGDVEVARKVLQSKKGVCATLGGKGKIDASNIDIAIEFKSKPRHSPATSRRPARPRLSACNWRGQSRPSSRTRTARRSSTRCGWDARPRSAVSSCSAWR